MGVQSSGSVARARISEPAVSRGRLVRGAFPGGQLMDFSDLFFQSFQRPNYTLTLYELSARTTRNDKIRSYAF